MRFRFVVALGLIIMVTALVAILAAGTSEKKTAQPTILEGLDWTPRWVSHLGCLKGCLDYMNIEVSDAWLYGISGHAFVINLSPDMCPSGPTAWEKGRLYKLAENIGCRIERLEACVKDDDFSSRQKSAWDAVRMAVDRGYPCYGWEMEHPEYYVINGYDEDGYYFKGVACDKGEKHKDWDEIGETEIGIMELAIVRPGEPANDKTAIKEALEFAVQFANSPPKWILEGYFSGPAAFETWIDAMKDEKSHGLGTAYNAAVWAECRGYAVGFLEEAKKRLSSDLNPLFDEAIGHYRKVADNLKEVAEIFPFLGVSDEEKEQNIKDAAGREKAAGYLESAREAEIAGLMALQKIVDAI